ncbi:MAG: hypothetical protein A4S09_16580 [Proteobacteria bacterium SG_bin7]|nr:MAG: hypothetical protein A4S09_16580 [Proteobacteria bacterium SG_bin7]
MRLLIKVLVSALIVALASEAGKRSTTLASILAALPLTSILILTWYNIDNGDTAATAKLSTDIAFAVLPTIVFLFCFPVFIRHGFTFKNSLLGALAIMTFIYIPYVWVLKNLNIAF